MTARSDRNGEMRLEILKSAAAAFRRRGYYGASVDEIASALHMTKGNLYYYFRDKEDILFACHEYALDLLPKMLKKVEDSSHPPQEKLRRVIVSFVYMMIDELRGTALTMVVQALSASRRKRVIAKRDRFDRGIRRISCLQPKSFAKSTTPPTKSVSGFSGGEDRPRYSQRTSRVLSALR